MADLASFHIEPLGDTNLLIVRDESNNVLCTTVTSELLRDIDGLIRELLGDEHQRDGVTSNTLEDTSEPIVPEALPEPRILPTVRRRYRPITSTGRIAIVFFPIVEPGGINTYVNNLQRAWRRAGHEVDLYYATPKGRMRNLSENSPTLVGKWFRLAGKQIAYGTESKLRAAQRVLNSYDFVLFAHQCPHPDIRGNGERQWQQLYDLKRPVFTVFHDNIWDRAYPWLEEVKDLIDVCLCTNPRIARDSGAGFPGHFVYTPHPLDTSDAGLYRGSKSGRVVWLPQWKAWKGIKLFAQACRWLEPTTDVYNSGIEYYQLRKQPWFKKSFGEDHWDSKTKVRGNPNVRIWGPMEYDRVPAILQMANISVDLTGTAGKHSQGQYSYVMVESMLYGATPFVYESVLQKPSPVPADCVYAIVNTDPKNIAEEINELMKDRGQQLAISKRGLEWARETFDENRIAAAILELVGKQFPHEYAYKRLKV
jgi:glycosyltransferase involved in cell wall biosynthesis